MPAQLYDTQHGATLALVTDAIAFRLLTIPAVKATRPIIDITHHGTTGDREKVVGDLDDHPPITVRIQNSPSAASPSRTPQTITITGPIPPGGTTGEIISGTGIVSDYDMSPGYEAGSEALQIKELTIVFDGMTGPTRTAAT